MDYAKCSNISIDAVGLVDDRKTNYEHDVTASLNAIEKSKTGKAVFAEITRKSKRITIQPYDENEGKGKCNAIAKPVIPQDSRPIGAPPRNTNGSFVDSPKALSGADILAEIEGKVKPSPKRVGTGKGSDSNVFYSPDTFAPGGSCSSGIGTEKDERLLHEIVHAMRHSAGLSMQSPIIGNPGMNNYEELVAIMITNLYRSESKRSGLRRDHKGYLPLTDDTKKPDRFAQVYFNYLLSLNVEQPLLFKALKDVPGKWNPLQYW